MEIKKVYENKALIDYYSQIRDMIPGHTTLVDVGALVLRARISAVDKSTGEVTFEILPEEEEKLKAVLK